MKNLTLKHYDRSSDFAYEWANVAAEDAREECELFSFRYNGKHRLGRLNYSTGEIANFQLLEDGNDAFELADRHFKSFKLADMHSISHVVKADPNWPLDYLEE